MLNILSILLFLCLYKNQVLSIDSNPELPEKVVYKLEDISDLFNEFTAKYNKKYGPAEYEYRHKVFVDNLIQINGWNSKQSDAVFGIGPFTDLTYEEFIQTHTGVFGNLTNDNVVKYEPTGMAPESLDWRQHNLVTRVKSQGSCGSCYIFSAIGNIEGLHAKKTGQLISLSDQQSLDCNSNGCGGGWPHDVMQALASRGCMRESDYPYVGQQGQCRSNPSKIVARVSGGRQISVGSEEGLKDALATYGPLSIVISTNPEFQGMQGGVFRPSQACNRGLHAVLLVGYGSDRGTPYWLIKNSWGQSWNEQGYLRLIRGQGACQIGMYAASATIA